MRMYLAKVHQGLVALWNRYVNWAFKFTKKEYNIEIGVPLNVNPEYVDIENYTRIQSDVKLISSGVPIKIKKFTAIGSGCLIIPGSHTPTVGIPQFLSTLHINDTGTGIIINEDCWIGAEAALLSKCELGRGCIIGTRATVTKDIPPYAVVAGIPAKIIATRFTLEQILEHERILYSESERLSMEYLKKLFDTTYKGFKAIGTSVITKEDLKKLNKVKENLGIQIFS